MYKILLFLLISSAVFAQRPDGVRMNIPNSSQTSDSKPKNAGKSAGKLLDDSTKNVYGPTTTRYFLQNDLLNNRKKLYAIDTNHTDFHRWAFSNQPQLFADLGSLNTAARPLFYEAPKQIGTQMGYDAYSVYGIDIQDVRYYDTRSPFTSARYFQGPKAQSLLHFDYARNVNNRLNVGFHLERMYARKHYGLGRGSRQSDLELAAHWNLTLHTNYRSKNEKYALLAHWNLFEHNAREQAGLFVGNPAKADWDSVFQDIPQSREVLLDARSRDRRDRLHVYQEYVPLPGFQVFHEVTLLHRYNRFADPSVPTGITRGFYRKNVFRTGLVPDTLRAVADYWLFENKIGLKGKYKGFDYRASVRRRDFSIRQTATTSLAGAVRDSLRQDGFIRKNENFLGLWLSITLKDSSHLEAEGEYLLGADYRLSGIYTGKRANLRFTSTLNSPSFFQERFLSGYIGWDTNLKNVFTNQIQASIPLKINKLNIEPTFSYSLTANMIYFDTAARVQQADQTVSLLRTGFRAGYETARFFTQHEVNLSASGGADVLRVPALNVLSQVGLSFVYGKVMFVRTGLDIHYRSGYRADFFNPLTQQFHLNDAFRVPGFATVDVFADVRINRVRMSFTINNLGEGIIPRSYFITPYHPGLRRGFSFGLSWPLFD